MDIYDEIDLADCPDCGGVGALEEEGGWCVYVQCLDCGAHTAEVSYKDEAGRLEAARKAAANWNFRKIIHIRPGE